MIDDHKLKLQTRRIIMPSSHLQFKFQLNMNKIERSKDHLLIFKMTIQIFSLHYDFHFDFHDNSI